MKYTKSVETIYTTTDYDGFIFTDWNRNVSNARVVKMVESIKTTGWLPNPVLVNEKFEVIDGQSRVKALERLGMPVQFCIKKGIGRKECQQLNLFQKNWSNSDFINSYASYGNDNYIWLKSIMAEYKELSSSIVQSIAAGKGAVMAPTSVGRIMDSITDGTLEVDKEGRKKVEEELFYLSRFAETITYIGGRKDNFYGAVLFMYNLDDIDNERVCRVVNKAKFDGLIPAGNAEGWLRQLEDLYNKSLPKANRVDVMHEYKVAV